ncbi:MAG: signal peptide peptidase SppA [Chloroflexi bacterium]|nr:signal peptide peptidase SppA [Chloroflexota bacterium]
MSDMPPFPSNDPQRGNFASGQFFPPPPIQPPPTKKNKGDASVVNRTAMWVLLSTIVGMATPICLCACVCLFSFAGLSAWANRLETNQETGPAVGVIELNGPIIGGDNAFSASTGYLREQIKWMEDNDDVKAIVIRANSPGGGVDPSDTIWHEVEKLRSKKPIVVSVQGLCASGCLYISSAATEIWATRSSLVGSIGVISTFFNAQELLDDLGIDVQTIATGENKDFGSMFRPLTPEEEQYWRSQSEILLTNFIQAVASRPGSTLTEDEVRELATGRVWVASEAKDRGLVDGIGYEEDAIQRAADLAQMTDYRVQEYPFAFDFLNILSGTGYSAAEGLSKGYFHVPTTQELLDSLQQAPLQYRYLGPYDGGQSQSLGLDR